LVNDESLVVDNLGYWDSYFPYAVVFGLSKVWINAFEQAGAHRSCLFLYWVG